MHTISRNMTRTMIRRYFQVNAATLVMLNVCCIWGVAAFISSENVASFSQLITTPAHKERAQPCGHIIPALMLAEKPVEPLPLKDEGKESQESCFAKAPSLEGEEGLRYRETLRKLAELSLEDYKWRSSVFKSNEADRMVEETIARMQGKDPIYVRPMDASQDKIGPLGRLEKSAVEWLSQVIDEEGRRAKKIIDANGQLIRPIESDELGPLGMLEQEVVTWLRSIRSSEKERVRTNTLRPMDLEESLRGPLGQMEEGVILFFKEIRESEFLRFEQSQARGGAVRPIDIPGPLGELELRIGEILKAEELRVAEQKNQHVTNGQSIHVLRPKDAKVPGPLGESEQRAIEFWDQLSSEEKERLRNIKQYLQESRPMENERESALGILEAITVGVIRAPLLLLNVVNRVRELMHSEPLGDMKGSVNGTVVGTIQSNVKPNENSKRGEDGDSNTESAFD